MCIRDSHYTVNKKRRRDDAYTPGGKGGARPNHAAVVYSNLIRRTFKETPIILGGIEASLRRLAHYDYWSDSLKRSILLLSLIHIYRTSNRSIGRTVGVTHRLWHRWLRK